MRKTATARRADLSTAQVPFSQWTERRAEFVDSCGEWLKATDVEEQIGRAQTVSANLLRAYWKRHTSEDLRWWRPWRGNGVHLPLDIRRLARDAAEALDEASLVEASFLLSAIYTGLLPAEVRTKLGAFYTPPLLAERLLDLAAAEGINWARVTVLDPACGGGAFLTPVANRVLGDHRIQAKAPAAQLRHLEQHLVGIEVDPFAAWMSATFLQLMAYPLSQKTGRPLRSVVETRNALEVISHDRRRFGLVIGNPPYGRVGLTEGQREFFGRSLFGHANTYTLFLDAALRWRDTSGLVAFVTPTSFLGGQYFSKLRALLQSEAPPLTIDIVESRTGVFETVQQETCLAVFGDNPDAKTAVHHLRVDNRSVSTSRAGVFWATSGDGGPWFLPRTPEQARVARGALRLGTRLVDLGYRATTGPLVWNRLKSQLRAKASSKTYPLIWAEAVRPNRFNFQYRLRAKSPFFLVESHQCHLVTAGRCVLVQRTTAKEQRRRLIACSVPEEFLDTWGGLVVENHVNVLIAEREHAVPPKVLAAVLNTRAVDLAFRCLSGSVAVSATELHALPLPNRQVFCRVEELLAESEEPDSYEQVEALIAAVYGIDV